jgi:lipopolysaccharide export system protein LptA
VQLQVSQIRLWRRLLIGLIAAVSLAVAVNYIQSWRRRNSEPRTATQILSPEVLRSAEKVEHLEHEKGVVKFRLRAQKLLETRQGKNYLQGIEAHDFNPDGSVRNQVNSQTCEYDPVLKKIFFSGDVRLVLGKDITLRMESLHYDHNNQTGFSDDRLQLASPQVSGTARGVIYDNLRRNLEFKRDLDLVLLRPVIQQDGTIQKEAYHLTAQHGYYLEAELRIRLEGGARLISATGTLAGERIEAAFTPDKRHLTEVICQGNALYRATEATGNRTIQGERIELVIGEASKALERIRVLHGASLALQSPSGEQKLAGEEINLELDAAKGVPRIIRSQSGVSCTMTHGAQTMEITGDSLQAGFAVENNSLEAMTVHGHASMNRVGGNAGPDALQAEDIRLSFRNLEGRSIPAELVAENAVRWRSPGRIDTSSGKANPGRSLTAAFLQLRYASAGDWLETGTAIGGVELTTLPASSERNSQLQRLQCDRVRFDFYPGNNQLESLAGDGKVQVTYRRASRTMPAAQAEESRTSSSSIRARFGKADGSVESVTQLGNFTYQDATRKARSGSCEFTAATDTLVLRDDPSISDAEVSARGEVVDYNLGKKELAVRGSVWSVLKSAHGKEQGLLTTSAGASSPTIVTADEMLYSASQARLRYSGKINLLSANSQLQADVLEILNRGAGVEALGNVRHLILGFWSAGKEMSGPTGRSPTGKSDDKAKMADQALIRSARLQYSRNENLIHYEGRVLLESAKAIVRADTMDAYLDAEGRSIERGHARGKLVITQPGREVTGDEAEYLLSQGKIVVTGNLAQLKDKLKGTTQAPQLTFYTTDDRISFGIRPPNAK